MMEGPVISTDVLARYAGDAAQEVDGVSALTRGAAEVTGTTERADVVVHLELEWGAPAADVARRVQDRVAEYLERMANVGVGSVDVVVEGVGAPPARQT
jgi:uncharacterized alkaline shock family protein YloU